jgi:regulator of protease activity HflC (stomatin/prohibitin superfamily)
MKSHIGLLIVASIGGLIGLFVMFGSWYTVDQGEVGVVLRNGAVVATVDAGLHFQTPWFESVQYIETRQQKVTYQKMEAYSKDLQPANLTITVNYDVAGASAADLYGKYGTHYVENILQPAVYSAVKIVFGHYEASTAIANRAQMVIDMRDAVQKAITYPDIHVDALQLENVAFSEQFIQSVEMRMQKEIEVSKQDQQLRLEKINADIVRTQASGQADAVRVNAQAQADQIKLVGEAQADAIRARAEALKSNPSLVNLTAVEKWNGILPTTMVPGSTLPFLGLNQQPQP